MVKKVKKNLIRHLSGVFLKPFKKKTQNSQKIKFILKDCKKRPNYQTLQMCFRNQEIKEMMNKISPKVFSKMCRDNRKSQKNKQQLIPHMEKIYFALQHPQIIKQRFFEKDLKTHKQDVLINIEKKFDNIQKKKRAYKKARPVSNTKLDLSTGKVDKRVRHKANQLNQQINVQPSPSPNTQHGSQMMETKMNIKKQVLDKHIEMDGSFLSESSEFPSICFEMCQKPKSEVFSDEHSRIPSPQTYHQYQSDRYQEKESLQYYQRQRHCVTTDEMEQFIMIRSKEDLIKLQEKPIDEK